MATSDSSKLTDAMTKYLLQDAGLYSDLPYAGDGAYWLYGAGLVPEELVETLEKPLKDEEDISSGKDGETGVSYFYENQQGSSVNYSNSMDGVEVNLAEGWGRGGLAEGDTYSGVVNVIGSVLDDRLHGNDQDNALIGLHGNDRLFGGKGNDYLDGGAGEDVLSGGEDDDRLFGGRDFDQLIGGSGEDQLYGGDAMDFLWGGEDDDRIFGGDGDDRLFGESGRDYLNGGAGDDWALYDRSAGAVHVDLQNGTAFRGDAAGDTLVSIENIAGSQWNDVLTGDAAANVLFGDGGSDQLSGGAGGDRLVGGAGADGLDGGTEFDIADYQTSSGAVEIDLALNIARGGDAEGDTLTSIEGLIGSWRDDRLLGDAADNQLDGSVGNDVIAGRGGDDVLTGGHGMDIFIFVHQDNAERDIITDFEVGIDKIDLSDTEFDLDCCDPANETAWQDMFESGDGDYMEQVGNDVVIHSSDTDTITLQNVQMSDLTQNDFIFA